MSYYKNWKCYSYGLYGSTEEYEYQTLKEYFDIDGSDVAFCKKDILEYKADNYYQIEAGGKLNGKAYGFVIMLK